MLFPVNGSEERTPVNGAEERTPAYESAPSEAIAMIDFIVLIVLFVCVFFLLYTSRKIFAIYIKSNSRVAPINPLNDI